ncbi:hypothetical protein [Pyrococcus abyssi]|nr:hypothetical protein [Pyrococcus abyssi]CCE70789.1 TPA: hypothetical protein PAB0887 [Pyrococcus abyssi GE5]
MDMGGMKKVLNELENGRSWVAVTVKTREGPTKVLETFEKYLKDNGWKPQFKANWWSSNAFGVAMFEAEKGKEHRVVLVKWVVTEKEEVMNVESKDDREGRTEFYALVDMISDDLIFDSVLRHMMSRY